VSPDGIIESVAPSVSKATGGSVVAQVLDVPVNDAVPASVVNVSSARRTIWTLPLPAFEIFRPLVVTAGQVTGTVTSVAT